MPSVSTNAATVIHAMRCAKREDIVVPYKWAHGHTWAEVMNRNVPRRGMDCSGFVMWSMDNGGHRPLMDRLDLNPAKTTSATMAAKLLPEFGLPVAGSQWERGALVFYYSKSMGRIGHVALVIAPDYIIHASKSAGGVVIARWGILPWHRAVLLP